MRDAHRRPALEDDLSVRVRGGRQDRRPAGAPPRSSRAGSRRVPTIVGRNSPAPTSATGPGIAPRVYLRDCGDDAAPALDPRRDDHRLRCGVPRRHGRELRAAEHRPRAAVHRLRCPRGPDLRRQRVPGGPRRLADPRRRAVGPLRTAPGLRDRSGRLRGHLGACAGSHRASKWLVVFRLLQGAAGAFLVPGALSIITQTFPRERARSGVRHLDRRQRRRCPCSVRSSAACSSTRSGGGSRSSSTCRCSPSPCVVTLRHVEEIAGHGHRPPVRLARFVVAALAVGGLSFGVDPRQSSTTGATPSPGWRSRSARSRWSPSRS